MAMKLLRITVKHKETLLLKQFIISTSKPRLFKRKRKEICRKVTHMRPS